MSAFTKDKILSSWLESQYDPAMALARNSDILQLVATDGPFSNRYVATYDARTLAQAASGRIVVVQGFAVAIRFPPDYLRRTASYDVLSYIGPYLTRELRAFHSNLNPPFICISLAPGTALTDILYSVYELFTWQRYGLKDDGLNAAASAWARAQGPERFPVDARPLKWRRPAAREGETA